MLTLLIGIALGYVLGRLAWELLVLPVASWMIDVDWRRVWDRFTTWCAWGLVAFVLFAIMRATIVGVAR